MSKLELRAAAVECFILFSQDIDRQRQEVEELKTRIENQLLEPGNDTRKGGQSGSPTKCHIVPIADDDGSDEAAQPGYLGLVVDEAHGEVRRTGQDYERLTASFIVGTSEWHTFLVAWKAENDGATEEAWRNGYPGGQKLQSRRAVKRRVNEKLGILDVRLEKRVPPKLIDKNVTNVT
jgi:hypothetical protein